MKSVLGRSALLIGAVLIWASASQQGTTAGQAGAFACAAAGAIGAFWPHIGLSLLITSFMALGMDRTHLDVPGPWDISFLILFSAGAAHILRRHPSLACITASLPFWAMAQAVPFLMYVALGLVFAGLVQASLLPLIPRVRKTGVTPLASLAHGPLIDVPPRIFRFNRGRKFLWTAILLCSAAVFAGGILWLAGSRTAGLLLVLCSGIIGLTFTFSLWYSNRVRFRIDSAGIHSRQLFREKTIRWNELGALSLRYLFFPGFGLKYVYYCVLSPSMEINFPNTMTGAAELRDLIERASGVRWQEP